MIKPVFSSTAIAAVFLALLLPVGFAGEVCAGNEPASSAQKSVPPEAWQKEFDDICSKTQDAMSFSEDELASLIQRCDALLPQIQKLDDTQKKVYTGRIRMCRGLYAYVLDSKKNEKK